MTDFSALIAPDRGEAAHAIHLVDKGGFAGWAKGRSAGQRSLLKALRFDANASGQFAILPGAKDGEFEVVAAVAKLDALTPWCLARLSEGLPEGRYRLVTAMPD